MRMPSLLRWSASVPLILALLWTPPSSGAAETDAPSSDLLLILDASGSMWGQIDGENKIVIARRVVADLVDGLPDSQQLGLVAYGHRREGDCEDIEMVSPLGPLDRTAFKATVDGLNPKGKTPITRSVERAFEEIGSEDTGTTVILVSDGLETCGGDPCAAVRAAKSRGLEFVMHVIGFDVGKENVAQLECAAQAGGGLYLAADDAQQLGTALEAAVALAPETPAGGLVVEATTDGELQDVAIHVNHAETGKDAGGGRTYTHPETNPRRIPLAAGSYDVLVKAIGMKGDIERRFQITVPEGETVEKALDFSAAELKVGATRNGELSDATVRVYVAGTRTQAAARRTYGHAKSNPVSFRLTAGTYDVEIQSVEIEGEPTHEIEALRLEPGGAESRSHEFKSGTLRLGAVRDGELVDTVLSVRNSGGKSVAQGRTYTHEKSNPKTFHLTPGEYRLSVEEIRGETVELSVTIEEGATLEKMVEIPSP